MHEVLKEIEYICTHLEDKTLDSVMSQMNWVDTECSFQDMLDDCYGEIDICGYRYYRSIAFQIVDPIAYACAYCDYVNNNEALVEYCSQYYHVDQLKDWIDQYEHLKQSKAV